MLALRGEVNKVIEGARTDKAVGANADARLMLHTDDVGFGAFLARAGWVGFG